MARRKSLAVQLFEAHQKKKEAQARAERQAEKEFLKEQARLEREAEAEKLRRERAAEKERQRQAAQQAREREREEAQAKRAAEAALREQARKAAQVERDLKQREAERHRQRTARTIEQRRADAEARTAAIRTRVTELDWLLVERSRGFRSRSREAEDAFNSGGSPAFVDVIHAALASSAYPHGLHGGCKAAFRPESRELLVDYELPRQDVIPPAVGYRYVKTGDELRPEPRKETETRKLYQQLIARVALRVVAEVFDVSPAPLVDSVVFNGHVSAKDRATGKSIRPCLISVNATRELVDDLVLDEPELDPVRCLGHLNAIVSPHPYDLEAVRPVVEFDLSKYKFVEEMDIVAGLDSRPDLLALKPVEFEQLVRRLFEQIGMKSWVTQSSRDDGVDAVAVNEDPVVGGLCVIQAKRYKNIVGLEAVHALAGVMADKAATKGILVTTSWVGKTSRDFATRNGRMEIIEGRGLKQMLQEHLGIDALIGLPKLPPGWEPRDVT